MGSKQECWPVVEGPSAFEHRASIADRTSAASGTAFEFRWPRLRKTCSGNIVYCYLFDYIAYYTHVDTT
jgi:hypothetical protein